MAIRFEDKGEGSKPAKKEVGGKAYVAEEPSAEPRETTPGGDLPFGKPVRPEKKTRKPMR